MRSEGHARGEFGNVDEPDIVGDDIAAAIFSLPAHRSREAGVLGREENIRLCPEHIIGLLQGHGTPEPRALAGVVAALPHFHFLDLPVLVPGDPVCLAAPFFRVADPVDPVAVTGQQQEDFPSRFVSKNDRADFAMIGDDGEEEFVETEQLRLLKIAADTPALTAAQRDFDGFEKPGNAGFELLGGQPHLAFRQPVYGRSADHLVEAEGENGQR